MDVVLEWHMYLSLSSRGYCKVLHSSTKTLSLWKLKFCIVKNISHPFDMFDLILDKSKKKPENQIKIPQTIFTLFQKGHFLPVLDVSCKVHNCVPQKNNWNKINNWKNSFPYLYRITFFWSFIIINWKITLFLCFLSFETSLFFWSTYDICYL